MHLVHTEIVTAQKSLADSMKTPLQPSKTVTKKAENEDLPVKYEQLPEISIIFAHFIMLRSLVGRIQFLRILNINFRPQTFLYYD